MNSIKNLRTKLKENERYVELLFYVAFSVYYFQMFLITTMFDTEWFVWPYRLSAAAVMVIVVIRLIEFDIRDWKAWLLIMMILGCTGIYGLLHRDKTMLIFGLFLVAAKDIPFRRIVQLAVGIGTTIMVTAFVASQAGIIEDLVYFQRGTYRHAFGIIYTTDFAAHILFLLLGFFYLKEGKVKPWICVLLLAGVAVMYHFVRARNNSICMIVLILGTLIYQFIKGKYGNTAGYKKWSRILCICMSMSFLVGAAVMIYWTVQYDAGNEFYAKLDRLLSGRLQMGQQAFTDYGLSIWGQEIPQMGFGRTTEWPEFYFCLDSSYVLVLLEKGIVLFFMICMLSVLAGIKSIVSNKYTVFLLMIIALQCVVEHHWTDISYNYLLLMAFAKQD